MANVVKQVSIFLENKAGSLIEILELLSAAKIRIVASTLSDTTEYGILRILTDDSVRACDMLKSNSKNAVLGEVFALECGSAAGSLHGVLKHITDDGVSVEYMYCFASSERSVVVFRLSDTAAAMCSIERHGIVSLSDEELRAM